MNIDGLDFRMTCPSCPEQYDVWFEGRKVAYVRLRHGRLTVKCPYPESWPGNVVYSHDFETCPEHSDAGLAALDGSLFSRVIDPDDDTADCGEFHTDDERRHHLWEAAVAIARTGVR